MRSKSLPTLAAVLVALTTRSLPTLAQTYTWINNTAGTQDWHNASNWSPTGVPTDGADVIIPAGTNTVSIASANVSLSSLSVDRTLTVGAGRTLNATGATISARLNLAAGTTLTTNATLNAGSSIDLPPTCSTPASFVDCTFDGDVNIYSYGRLRLHNTVFNNALVFNTLNSLSEVLIDPGTSFVGTLRNSNTSNVYITATSPGTVTFASGSVVEGRDIYFTTGTCTTTAWSMVNLGTIRQNIVGGNPIEIRIPMVQSNVTLEGPILIASTVDQSTVTMAPGSTLALPGPCTTPAYFIDSVFEGDVNLASYGRLRLHDAVFNDALIFNSNNTYSEIALDPGTTFTGTLRNNNSSNVYVTASGPGTVTFAEGSVVEGRDIQFTTGQCVSNTWSMINLGTIRQTIPGGSPIQIRIPMVQSNVTLGGTISLSSTIEQSNVTMSPGSMLAIPGPCASPAYFIDSVFEGDVNMASYGRLRLHDAVFNDALIFNSNSTYSEISLDPGTTFTGTLRNNNSSNVYVTASGPGNVTFAEGSVVEGRDINFTDGQCATNAWSMTNLGTIRQTIPSGSPIQIRIPMVQSNVTLGGVISVASTIEQSNVTMSPGSMLAIPAPCAAPAYFIDSVFDGDVNIASYGRLRLHDAVFNDALVFNSSSNYSEIALDPNTAFIGTLRNANSSNVYVTASAPGTVTLAEGSVIEGRDITFNTGQCTTNAWSLLNLGTIVQNISGGQIAINVPLINFGAISGNVTNPNGTPLPSYTTASPTQTATVPSDRNDPDPSSGTTFTYQNLVLETGTYFGLGPNETLNLDNGNGTLVIGEGATFSGNGIIFGNVINQGLLRIPITRIPNLPNISGGVTVIYSDYSYGAPVYIPAPEPIHTNPRSYFSFFGSGLPDSGPGGPGGTGGGSSGTFASGGGHYVVNTPSVTVQGTTGWDGELEITGTFEQTETGFLRLFIAGNEQGESYSLLSVGQEATINGTIQIVLDPILLGYTPNAGDSFDMIIADGGITTAPGLAIQTLITAQGAQALGLDLDPFESPFLMDPDELVQFPTNIFDMALVDDGTTLRFTLNQPICSPQPVATTQPACGRDIAEFTVPNAGSGPFTFQWQIEDAPDSDTWSNIDAGFYDWLGTVLTPTGRTMSIRKPRIFASGIRFRCVVTNPCDTVVTAPVALAVLDQTEETCGNCPICEADFDDNGGVDGGDLAAFFAAFEEGVLCADVDRNGGVDGGDLATFFTLFEIGGCE